MRIWTADECIDKCLYKKARGYYMSRMEFVFWEYAEEDGKVIRDLAEPIDNVTDTVYTYKPEVIEQEIAEITFPLDDILKTLNFFIVPYPSSRHINGSAYRTYDSILFYGRCTIIPQKLQRHIIAHELGHIVQDYLANDDEYRDKTTWFYKYLQLRGWEFVPPKKWINNEYVEYDGEFEPKWWGGLPWDERPTEWFAEDFRYLFGSEISKTEWNMTVPAPDEKVRNFFLEALNAKTK